MDKFPVSGKPIPEINLAEISIGELQDMTDPRKPAKEANEMLARASGMTADDIKALRVHDYRALVQAVFEKSWKPLDDPKT